MRPVPFALKKCDLTGCERGAHGQLADGRYICDLHMFLFGKHAKEVEKRLESEATTDSTDVLEQLEEGKFLPGDEAHGLKSQE